MPDLRKDPIVGRWVIISTDRANRPLELPQLLTAPERGFDPFLEGNEKETPPELLAYRDAGTAPNQPGWRVRVIPNKFPALQEAGTPNRRRDGIFDIINGVGAHEVIIECPHDEESLARLSEENICEVISAYRERLLTLKQDARLAHGLIFKNKGADAGASLPHSHSQLIATPVVPIAIWDEMTGSEEFFRARGRCIYCEMIEQELATGSRVILDHPRFIAFCPFASRFPFETWILPKDHSSHFENIRPAEVAEMGVVLKIILSKLHLALDDPSYNYMIHSAPFQTEESGQYHWHLEIIPQLSRIAGFEWGSGFYINPVLPEHAAALLCEVDVGPCVLT